MKTKNLAVGVLAAVLVAALWYTFLLKPTRAQDVEGQGRHRRPSSAKLEPLQAQLAQAQRDASHAAAVQGRAAVAAAGDARLARAGGVHP